MESVKRDLLLVEAERAVAQYVAAHPGCAIDGEQPDYRGGTNRVTLGTRGDQPVVFKYFVTAKRWAGEHACLKHFQPTGIVPRLIDAVPDRLLVIERIGGCDGLGGAEAGSLTVAQRQSLGRQVGHALGKIASTPLPPPGSMPTRDVKDLLRWPAPLDAALDWYVAAGRRVQEAIPAYGTPFCSASLTLLASQSGPVGHARQILFHEDIWNMRVDGDRFLAFYDLEMCRLGTESMQLGVAVELCGPGRLDWSELQRGYEQEVGRPLTETDLLEILAMNHLYHWIRACRWGEWDGDPDAIEQCRAAAEDAEHHVGRMQAACRVLGEHVDLGPWF